MSPSWCGVCNTLHDVRGACPGALRITEPERHGWRVLVSTGHRTEVYGVLVAPAGGWWRARILTFPNMLWSVPGGRGTLKFAGATPAEAEKAAIDFIRQHCSARGHVLLGEPAMVEGAALDEESQPTGAAPSRILGRPRYLKVLGVRFGTDKPTEEARTADLSSGGLFVVTDRALPPGTEVRMRLDLEGFAVPLNGRVAWHRPTGEPGRPPGMGIELAHAPPMYQRYVDALRKKQTP